MKRESSAGTRNLADAYLNIAEQILTANRAPMRPKEILKQAYLSGTLPAHLFGETQHKTLHARLSEDIAVHRETSRFFRTAPGIFFVRQLKEAANVNAKYRVEFFATPRRKELKRDWVMALELGAPPHDLSEGYEYSLDRLRSKLDHREFGYYPYSVIRRRSDLTVVHSFVVVWRERMVLSYKTGRFFPATDPLRGRRSLGVGGAVLIGETDMLYESMHGIVANGINELGYAIGLPRRQSELARYQNEVSPKLAIVVPQADLHPGVVHVVMTYRCPDDFIPTKAAMSINDLRWVSADNPTNNIDDFDPTSRFLTRQGRLSDILSRHERP